jgi:hypothetical protein
MRLTEQLPEDLRCGILYCQETPRRCFNLVIQKRRGPAIMMHYPSKKLNWYYRGALTGDAIVAWVNAVLAGSLRPAGPGAGLVGFSGIYSTQPRTGDRLGSAFS